MVEDRATSTRVTIFGETYSIKSQAEPEYTNKVAEQVDRTMHMIKKQVGLQDPLKIAILASMSITDELFQARETAVKKSEELENKCSSLINLIGVYLEGNKAEEVLSG
jgi:cell division protein ZapA